VHFEIYAVHTPTNVLFINLGKSSKFTLKYTTVSLLHVSVFNDHHQELTHQQIYYLLTWLKVQNFTLKYTKMSLLHVSVFNYHHQELTHQQIYYLLTWLKSSKFTLKYTTISLLHVSAFNDHNQGALSVPDLSYIYVKTLGKITSLYIFCDVTACGTAANAALPHAVTSQNIYI
jgi:hypothetical protein